MKCPTCATEMDRHARHGVTIDHCPACGGVWLDKGELDHLIAAVRPPLTLQDPDPVRQAPKPPQSIRHTPRKPAKPAPVEDRKRATRRKPGKAQRYTKRYPNRARFRDILEEIFDFD